MGKVGNVGKNNSVSASSRLPRAALKHMPASLEEASQPRYLEKADKCSLLHCINYRTTARMLGKHVYRTSRGHG